MARARPEQPLLFQWETVASFIRGGGLGLAEANYRESDSLREEAPLDIDIEGHKRREAQGTFRLFTARRGRNLVGYAGFDFFHPERFRSTLLVRGLYFWLEPRERRGAAGYLMVKAALAALPRPCILQAGSALDFENGRVSKIFERLGMRETDRIYTVMLKE